MELIADGRVIGTKRRRRIRHGFDRIFAIPASTVWLAARVSAETVEGEPAIRAHTNPRFLRHGAADPERRKELADHFAGEIEFYKQQPSLAVQKDQRERFFQEADTALQKLRRQ